MSSDRPGSAPSAQTASRPPPAFDRFLVPVVALGLGLVLIALAQPRLGAGLDMIPLKLTADRMRAGEPVPIPELKRAVQAGDAALARLADAGVQRDLGLVALDLAGRTELDPVARADFLGQAIAASRAALAGDPAQPYVWLRLAQAEARRGGLGPKVIQAYRMSLLTGPKMLDLLRPQVDLGLLLWPVLDPATRADVTRRIRGLARFKTWQLADIARRRLAIGPVRAALAAEPDLKAEFDRLYLKRRREAQGRR